MSDLELPRIIAALHLLDDLHRDGLAIVLTTHDLNGIASHLPHLVCLNGEVIGEGAPRDVLGLDVLEALPERILVLPVTR